MKNYFTVPGRRSRREVLVRRGESGQDYRWVVCVDGVCGEAQNGSLERLAEQYAALGAAVTLTLLLSADRVNLKTVALSDSELRHYRKLLPFALEDDLAEAAEALHFAFTRPVDGIVGVAIIRATVLADCIAQFAESGLALTAVVPELLLLPWHEDERTWMLQDGYLVAHLGRFDGVKVPQGMVPQLAELIRSSEGLAGAPRVTIVHERTEADALPDLGGLDAHFAIAWQRVDTLWPRLAARLPDLPLNILQGEFSAPLPWRQIRRQWAPVAVAAAAALLLNFGGLIYHYQAQKQLATELKAEQFALAREALPAGRIQSPERQLRALLNQSQLAEPTRFSALLTRVGPHLKGDTGYAVRSLNFDGRTSVLRLEVRAANFQQIELFRKTMKDNAVSAKLLNSSARGNGVLARLELSESRR